MAVSSVQLTHRMLEGFRSGSTGQAFNHADLFLGDIASGRCAGGKEYDGFVDEWRDRAAMVKVSKEEEKITANRNEESGKRVEHIRSA